MAKNVQTRLEEIGKQLLLLEAELPPDVRSYVVRAKHLVMAASGEMLSREIESRRSPAPRSKRRRVLIRA